MLQTRLTELLGCRYPVVQTAMGWVADPKLVAATCNAGGFGFLAGATIPAEQMERDILRTKELTQQPFGVNFHMYQPNATEIVGNGAAIASSSAYGGHGYPTPPPYEFELNRIGDLGNGMKPGITDTFIGFGNSSGFGLSAATDGTIVVVGVYGQRPTVDMARVAAAGRASGCACSSASASASTASSRSRRCEGLPRRVCIERRYPPPTADSCPSAAPAAR